MAKIHSGVILTGVALAAAVLFWATRSASPPPDAPNVAASSGDVPGGA